jgi:hypothetical protein
MFVRHSVFEWNTTTAAPKTIDPAWGFAAVETLYLHPHSRWPDLRNEELTLFQK